MGVMGIVQSQELIWPSEKKLPIGYPDDSCPNAPHPKMWFAKWFSGAIGNVQVIAPACIWIKDGNKITQEYKAEYVRPSGEPNPPMRIWILTGKLDDEGFQLGVWPD